MDSQLQRVVLAAMVTSTLAATAACGEPSADPKDSAAPTPVVTGPLKDGEYSAVADYPNPGGVSKLKVELTLVGAVVTALTVTPQATDATSRQYQQKFAGGINALVVGKPITELKVGAVAGSSLTQKGFEPAISEIIADAAE